MRLYIGFDDTDIAGGDFGTGKVARRFEEILPEGCRLWGVIRQQLLLDRRIPYTSHNSAACVVVDFPDPALQSELLERAVAHIERQAAEGSDPGLCLVCEGDPALQPLKAFGRRCTERIVTQKDAIEAARGIHLSGHGGTNDGIIGAAASVGLTASGWYGRFIEYGRLRDYPEEVSVSMLESRGIRVLSLDRDARVPAADERVYTKGWLRPRFLGHDAVLAVLPGRNQTWEVIGDRNRMKGGTNMAGKIFYRERRKVGEGEKQPRFNLAAVAGLDLKVYAKHLRKKELDQIAEALGAELILLEAGGGGNDDEVSIDA